MKHLSILDSEQLLRRIPPVHIVPKNGKLGISSAAFKNTTDTYEMSVDLSSKLVSQLDSVKKYPDNWLVSLTAKVVRKLNQGVISQPLRDNNAHGSVWGIKTKSVRNKFVSQCVFIKPSKTVLFFAGIFQN